MAEDDSTAQLQYYSRNFGRVSLYWHGKLYFYHFMHAN